MTPTPFRSQRLRGSTGPWGPPKPSTDHAQCTLPSRASPRTAGPSRSGGLAGWPSPGDRPPHNASFPNPAGRQLGREAEGDRAGCPLPGSQESCHQLVRMDMNGRGHWPAGESWGDRVMGMRCRRLWAVKPELRPCWCGPRASGMTADGSVHHHLPRRASVTWSLPSPWPRLCPGKDRTATVWRANTQCTAASPRTGGQREPENEEKRLRGKWRSN